MCLSPSAAALSHVISLPEGLAFTGLLLVPREEERAAWQDQVTVLHRQLRGALLPHFLSRGHNRTGRGGPHRKAVSSASHALGWWTLSSMPLSVPWTWFVVAGGARDMLLGAEVEPRSLTLTVTR